MVCFVMGMSADDEPEDDSVGGCGMSLDVLYGRGEVCSTVDAVIDCDEMQSVAVVGRGVEEDGWTCSWPCCGFGVGDRPLSLSHFARRAPQSGML